MLITTQIPNLLQQIMSSETNPVLSGTIPAFEMFMTAWETYADKNAFSAGWIRAGMALARKYYKRMDNTKAYVISMCEYYSTSYQLILNFIFESLIL